MSVVIAVLCENVKRCAWHQTLWLWQFSFVCADTNKLWKLGCWQLPNVLQCTLHYRTTMYTMIGWVTLTHILPRPLPAYPTRAVQNVLGQFDTWQALICTRKCELHPQPSNVVLLSWDQMRLCHKDRNDDDPCNFHKRGQTCINTMLPWMFFQPGRPLHPVSATYRQKSVYQYGDFNTAILVLYHNNRCNPTELSCLKHELFPKGYLMSFGDLTLKACRLYGFKFIRAKKISWVSEVAQDSSNIRFKYIILCILIHVAFQWCASFWLQISEQQKNIVQNGNPGPSTRARGHITPRHKTFRDLE